MRAVASNLRDPSPVWLARGRALGQLQSRWEKIVFLVCHPVSSQTFLRGQWPKYPQAISEHWLSHFFCCYSAHMANACWSTHWTLSEMQWRDRWACIMYVHWGSEAKPPGLETDAAIHAIADEVETNCHSVLKLARNDKWWSWWWRKRGKRKDSNKEETIFITLERGVSPMKKKHITFNINSNKSRLKIILLLHFKCPQMQLVIQKKIISKTSG